MEIFNTIRSQQTPPGGQGAEKTTALQQTAKAEHKQENKIEEVRQKEDTEKLKKELQEVVNKLNKEMNSLKTSIRFGFNDQVKELYVTVIDTSNNEEIRKIPSDEAMRLAAKMRELVGMIFDKKG